MQRNYGNEGEWGPLGSLYLTVVALFFFPIFLLSIFLISIFLFHIF